MDKAYYDIIVEGMRNAVLGGTCRAANIPGIEVCGKTGTAQNRGHDHSVFMGFAPMENQRLLLPYMWKMVDSVLYMVYRSVR